MHAATDDLHSVTFCGHYLPAQGQVFTFCGHYLPALGQVFPWLCAGAGTSSTADPAAEEAAEHKAQHRYNSAVGMLSMSPWWSLNRSKSMH